MLRKRTIILDSDIDFCLAVSAIIKNSEKFCLVRVYHNSLIALKNMQQDFPEVIVMDLDFQELSGLDFILKAREKMPGLNILVITHYEDAAIAFNAIGNGALGYLLKRRSLPALMEHLHILVNGGSPIDPHVNRSLVRSMQVNEVSPLTSRESLVLKLLTQGKTYSGIAGDLSISGETVKTHLKNIYRKLNVNSKAEAVKKALEDQLITGHHVFRL